MGFDATFAYGSWSNVYSQYNNNTFQMTSGGVDAFDDNSASGTLASAVGMTNKSQKVDALKSLTMQDFIDIGNSVGDSNLNGSDFAKWIDNHKQEALTNPDMLKKMQGALIIMNSPDLLNQMDVDKPPAGTDGKDGLFTAGNAFTVAQRQTA